MIVGNGLLAKELNSVDQEKLCFFASGVSDSKSTNLSDFDRERKLIQSTLTDDNTVFVYFSTCSILNPEMEDSPYVQFKLETEDWIQHNKSKFLIVRTSNIVGHGGNKKTIINYIADKISTQSKLIIWKNAWRNILDVTLLVKMLDFYIKNYPLNTTITLCNPLDTKVIDIVKSLENILNKKANVELINLGEPFIIDPSLSFQILNRLDCLEESNLDYMLNKYF